jgi:hypothetical protein
MAVRPLLWSKYHGRAATSAATLDVTAMQPSMSDEAMAAPSSVARALLDPFLQDPLFYRRLAQHGVHDVREPWSSGRQRMMCVRVYRKLRSPFTPSA